MSDLKLEIDGKEIVQGTSSKFHGVYIDQHLTWAEHIALISKKIAKISAYCDISVTAYSSAPYKDCITLEYFHICHTAEFLGVVIIPLF